jgi:hypothetical protein
MTLRRIAPLVILALVVLNWRRVRAMLIRWTGTNVHTERPDRGA